LGLSRQFFGGTQPADRGGRELDSSRTRPDARRREMSNAVSGRRRRCQGDDAVGVEQVEVGAGKRDNLDVGAGGAVVTRAQEGWGRRPAGCAAVAGQFMDDVLFVSGTRDLGTIAAVDWMTARLDGTLPNAPWVLVKAPYPG